VLRNVFGPKRDEVTGQWRILCNDELNDIVGMIKSKRMRWVGHVGSMGESRNVYRVLMRKPTE